MTEDIRKSIVGDPFGKVFPPRPPPQRAPEDGRTAGLELLKRYIAELTFYRKGGTGGPPIAFRIPTTSIEIEQPDNVVDLVFPAIAFLPAEGSYNSIGLTSFLEEETRDKYGKGTVLQEQSEYTETVILEIWANKRAERRSIIAGLENALVPTEQMYGIRFRMHDYYDQLVCFTLMSTTRIDNVAEVAKNRRTARMKIEMRYTVVQPVNYSELQPQLATDVKDGTDPFNPDVTTTLDISDT